mmetsp:Transcript_125332/g.348741  ORF Transcript_125332/g.348741 Transcript_125332/m.348741 type:complete len:99 (+) Transcript_125332:245-541(+)
MVNCEEGVSKPQLEQYAAANAGGAPHVHQLKLVGGGRRVDEFRPPGQKQYSGFYPYHVVIDGSGIVRMSGGYDFDRRKWLDYMAAAGLQAQHSAWQLR